MDSGFAKLKKAFVNRQEDAVVENDPDITTMSFSDMVYSVTGDKDEVINFQALGLDFMANPEGSFFIVESSEEGALAHEISDDKLKGQLESHLVWRSEVLTTHGF